jgi:uncharacterized protein (DUF427 family)
MTGSITSANPAPGFKAHPEHEIRLRPFAGTIAIYADTVKVAESNSAVLLTETNHAPIYYIPMEDVDAGLLRPSSHVTRCPFKGKASYWNLFIGEHEIDNALWGYEMPYDEMLELAGMVAFYPSKVEIRVQPVAD